MQHQLTKVHQHHSARKFKNEHGQPVVFNMDNLEDFESLSLLGIHLSRDKLSQMAKASMYAMDDQQGLIGTASIGVPVQFLQTWMPGVVRVETAARKIDDLVGMTVLGKWSDEELVQAVLESTNSAAVYSDYGNIPLASWNQNYERRTVVRFEQGFEVFRLEAERAAEVRVDSAGEKRYSVAEDLEVQRNTVGFFGFNNGNNRTYGFLNDPNLPAYYTVASGAASSPLWTTKTFTEICADITQIAGKLQTQSQDRINPGTTPTTLAVPTSQYQRLATPAVYGAMSVMAWIRATYPLMRVESAPQLNSANAGANVMYLYAETVQTASTDNGRVFDQLVPTKFMALGVQQMPKSFVEDFSMASAGILLKRPFAVCRASGI